MTDEGSDTATGIYTTWPADNVADGAANLAHPSCHECSALIPQAMNHAQATGSPRASYASGDHAAMWARSRETLH